MHRGKLVLLVLLLVVLGGAAWWRASEVVDPAAARGEVEFAPGVDLARVAAIRIESTERRAQIRLERDDAGRWWMVEPLAWRADQARVDALLDVARRGLGHVTPGVAPEAAGLAPPRFTLEFVERRLDGSERRHRIAFGAPTVDQDQVYVLVGPPGEALLARSSRAPISLLDVPSNDLRDRRLLHVEWNRITSLRREGSLAAALGASTADDDDEAPDAGSLELLAEPLTDGWFALQPAHARLDPHAMGLILRNAAQLRVRAFVDDAPEDLARWGLETPLARVEIEVDAEDRFVLELGVAPDEDATTFEQIRWLARVEGQPNVVALEHSTVWLLARPLGVLVDHQLARYAREAVREVLVDIDGRRLELARTDAGWMIVVEGEPRPADPGAVGDLLTALERLEAAGYPWLDAPGGGPGDAGLDGRIEIRVEVPGEEALRVLGGELAPSTEFAGVVGRPLRRFGEAVFGLFAEQEVGALARTPDSLLSTRLVALRELDQAEVVLSQGDRTRRWVRDPQKGHWSVAGTGLEDQRFALLVDGLMFLRAERWLPDAESAAVDSSGPEARLDVTVRAADGTTTNLVLGRIPGGADDEGDRVGARVSGRWAVVDGTLHARLSELLAGG